MLMAPQEALGYLKARFPEEKLLSRLELEEKEGIKAVAEELLALIEPTRRASSRLP
jgi:hypothetical protein